MAQSPKVQSEKFDSFSPRTVIGAMGLVAVGALLGFSIAAIRTPAAPEVSIPSVGMVPNLPQIDQRPQVETVKPTEGGLARITSQSGVAHSFESAELYAKVSGFLKTISVDIGSIVKEGDVLAEVDIPELEQDVESTIAAWHQSQAEVLEAEAHVQSVIADQKSIEAKVAQAKAEVSRFDSEVDLASKQLARIRELSDLKAIESRIVDEHIQQLESAKAAQQASTSAVKSAEQQALAAVSKIALANAALDVGKAKVEVAQSQVERAKLMLSYCKIRSPYDGVVTARNFHRGAFVRSPDQGGQTPILSVDRTDRMRVVVKVPERDVPYVHVGDLAQIRFDAFPRSQFEAPVARIAATEDATTRTMVVEIDLPNPDGLIRDQMYGRVEIALEDAPLGLTVPSTCLVGEVVDGKGKLFVVQQDKLVQRDVQLGRDTGIVVEVLAGIESSDLLVARPTPGLTSGAEVNALPPLEPPKAK